MTDTADVSTTATPFVAPKLVRKFSHAAAGHEGVLRDESGMLLIKPCLPKEVAFYESAVAHHPELAYWMPTFMGTLQLNEANTLSTDNITTTTTIPTSTSKPPLPTSIVLSNLTHPFIQPCVLDIKLGAQLWDDSAPLSKRERLDAVAASTTSKPLGLRIAGMKVWKGENDGYQIYDKQYGRQFTSENVIDGFKEFLSGSSLLCASADMDVASSNGTSQQHGLENIKDEVITTPITVKNDNGYVGGANKITQTTTVDRIKFVANRFLTKVQEIQALLESLETRMYSASLLFIYEGDSTAFLEALKSEQEKAEQMPMGKRGNGHTEPDDQDEEEEDEEDEDDDDDEDSNELEELKLIDFAHAEWIPGQGPDENMLHGVRNVVKLLQQICNG